MYSDVLFDACVYICSPPANDECMYALVNYFNHIILWIDSCVALLGNNTKRCCSIGDTNNVTCQANACYCDVMCYKYDDCCEDILSISCYSPGMLLNTRFSAN